MLSNVGTVVAIALAVLQGWVLIRDSKARRELEVQKQNLVQCQRQKQALQWAALFVFVLIILSRTAARPA